MAESERSVYQQTEPNYRKAYIALESDPEIFAELAHNLGGADGVEFHDIISLDPEMLQFIPRPVLAFILVFPPSVAYDEFALSREKAMSVYHGKGEDEPTIWFAQTIQNACGLYAILHALSNGIDRSKIKPGSPLDNLLTTSIPLKPYERALALEASADIEHAHTSAAKKGISGVPEPTDPIEHHYICFVKSPKDGHVYEMNGTSKGPICHASTVAETDDLLEGGTLDLVKQYIELAGGNVGFSLLGLTLL